MHLLYHKWLVLKLKWFLQQWWNCMVSCLGLKRRQRTKFPFHYCIPRHIIISTPSSTRLFLTKIHKWLPGTKILVDGKSKDVTDGWISSGYYEQDPRLLSYNQKNFLAIQFPVYWLHIPHNLKPYRVQR